MNAKRLDEQIESVAALADPVRRALYAYVGSRHHEVSRDQAARAARISRALAAFHLDKLVEAGLLEATFRRLSGRSGPGAGRTSKLYRRASRPIEISFPERHYALAGQLMASAIAEQGSEESLQRAARAWGASLGAQARERIKGDRDEGRMLEAAMDVLREAGFEPVRDKAGILLRNCPFDALAQTHRDVVCGMNRALLEGVVSGLRIRGVRAELDPQPGMCCVALRANPGR